MNNNINVKQTMYLGLKNTSKNGTSFLYKLDSLGLTPFFTFNLKPRNYEEGNDEVGRADSDLDSDGHSHGIRCHELHGCPLTGDGKERCWLIDLLACLRIMTARQAFSVGSVTEVTVTEVTVTEVTVTEVTVTEVTVSVVTVT